MKATLFSACGAEQPYCLQSVRVASDANPDAYLDVGFNDFAQVMNVIRTSAEPVKAGLHPPFTCTLLAPEPQAPQPASTAGASAVSMDTDYVSVNHSRRPPLRLESPWVIWRDRCLMSTDKIQSTLKDIPTALKDTLAECQDANTLTDCFENFVMRKPGEYLILAAVEACEFIGATVRCVFSRTLHGPESSILNAIF